MEEEIIISYNEKNINFSLDCFFNRPLMYISNDKKYILAFKKDIDTSGEVWLLIEPSHEDFNIFDKNKLSLKELIKKSKKIEVFRDYENYFSLNKISC